MAGGAGADGSFGRQITVYPTHTQRYTVTGIDPLGCEQEGSISIQVANSGFVNVQSSAGSICSGKEVELQASGAESYRWIGPELSATDQARVYARPKSNASYRVVGTNAQGCQDTADLSIAVGNLDVAFQMSTDHIDLASSLGVVDFTDLTEGAKEWRWDFGQGGQSSEANPVHVYDQVDTYVVTLLASDGICTGRVQQTLKVVNSSSLASLTERGKVVVTPETHDGLVELSLESPRDMYLRLRLLDEGGKQIVSAALRLKQGRYFQKLDLASFERGTYKLQLLDGQETLTRTIVYR